MARACARARGRRRRGGLRRDSDLGEPSARGPRRKHRARGVEHQHAARALGLSMATSASGDPPLNHARKVAKKHPIKDKYLANGLRFQEGRRIWGEAGEPCAGLVRMSTLTNHVEP